MSRVLRFEPHCEASVARGLAHYTAKREAAALGLDLETVMLFLAEPDDLVWLERAPRAAWLDELDAAGFPPPAIATGARPPPGEPAPWGWSPDAARRFRRRWDPALGALYSKRRWLGLLRELISEGGASTRGLCGIEDLGRACTSRAEVMAASARLAERGVETVGLKAPLGTSGRGSKRLQGRLVTDSQRGWIERTLAQQGAVIVEPWRDRLIDLSVLLSVSPGGARVLGVTRFETDARGQYLGAQLGDPAGDPAVAPWLSALHATGERVGAALFSAGHRGLAGVDAMVFAHPDGSARLKPLLEVNPRATMGHVALALRARLSPGAVGSWRLFGRRELAGAGARSFMVLGERLRAAHPPRLDGAGRIVSGAVFTNDPAVASACLGVARVTPPGRGALGG